MASETIMLCHNHPDVFEAKCMVSTTYSKEFRKLCAQFNDYIYQYCDMSEKVDLANVTSTLDALTTSMKNGAQLIVGSTYQMLVINLKLLQKL